MAYTLKQDANGLYSLDTQDVFKTTPTVRTVDASAFEAYTPQKTELVGGTDLTEQTKKIMREMPGQIQTITDPETGEVKTIQKGAGQVEVEQKPITSLTTATGAAIQPAQTALEKAANIAQMFPASQTGPGLDPNQYLDRIQQIQKDQQKSQMINTLVSKGLDLGISYLTRGGSTGIPQGAISYGVTAPSTPLSGGAFVTNPYATGGLAAAGTLLATGDVKQAAKVGVGTGVGTAIGTAVGGPIGGAIGGALGGAIGGRVICTELYNQGLINKKDYLLDLKFTESHLTPEHVKGYWYFAIPAVKSMRKSKLSTQFWKHIATNRIADIKWRLGKGKFNLLGRIYSSILEPFCKLAGKFVEEKDYNKELYA